jgi:hypothetical protein
MIKVSVKSSGQLSAFLVKVPSVLSSALNDSLTESRDKLIRESWPAAVEARASRGRGRRSITVRKREAGAGTFQINKSDENSKTGSIDINTGDAAEQTQAGSTNRVAVLAAAQDLIKAFVHSTSPRLAGVPTKERIRMALAVYYRRKRGGEFKRAIAERSKSDIFIDERL